MATPSPNRFRRQKREDAALERGGSFGEICKSSTDMFDIPSKNAPLERLRRWRKAALVLNAARRFRYTLDLKKEEEKEQTRRKIRTHAQVIRAALLFKDAGKNKEASGTRGGPGGGPVLGSGYSIGAEQLTAMTRDHDFSALQEYGGVKGLSNMLKTSLDKGVTGDDDDILRRRNAFGSNTYPQKKGRTFWAFLWEAWQDLTLIILMVAAAISLVLGIKTEGIKEGWYDGGSIAFAVILVILVTGNVMRTSVRDDLGASVTQTSSRMTTPIA